MTIPIASDSATPEPAQPNRPSQPTPAPDPYDLPQSFGAPSEPRSGANPYASPAIPAPPSRRTGLGTSKGIQNRQVDVSLIINYAFDIWKRHLGLLVGIVFVVLLLTATVGFGSGLLRLAFENMNQEILGVWVGLTGNIASNILAVFLGVGQTQIILKLARGQDARFEELFQGGPRFPAALGLSILLGLAIGVGFMLLVIPGIILLLMWWPAYYLVVDNKSGVIESFGNAQTITKGNWGTAILLWLVSMAIMLLGMMAFCIGILFAAPLVSAIWGTAYLMMSGQLPQQAGYRK